MDAIQFNMRAKTMSRDPSNESTVQPEFLAVQDAARYAGVGRSTLYKWMTDNGLRFHQPTTGGSRLIRRADLEAFITGSA